MAAKPVDLTMTRLLHSASKREIVRVRGCLIDLPEEDLTKAEGLASRWSFLSGQVRHHHDAEDRYLWPLALERSEHPEERVVIRSMRAEQTLLNGLLSVLDDDFAALARGDSAGRAGIAYRLDDLLRALSGHVAHEERDGARILAEYVPEREAKEFHGFCSAQEQAALTIPWVCDGSTPGEQAAAWRSLPFVKRVICKPWRKRKYKAFTKACGV